MFQLISQPPRAQTTNQETSQPKTENAENQMIHRSKYIPKSINKKQITFYSRFSMKPTAAM